MITSVDHLGGKLYTIIEEEEIVESEEDVNSYDVEDLRNLTDDSP